MPHCRIFIDCELAENRDIELPADQSHYLRSVMRLKPGDHMTLFNGEGGEYSAEITCLSKSASGCRTQSFHDINRELACAVHIIQCANKSEKIETVLQKGTELGAASFTIASSERSTFKLAANKLEKRLERWQRIIIEAAEQSERTAIPALTWAPSLKDVQARGLALVMHPDSATAWQALRDDIARTAEISFAIGPEGGWSMRDLAQLEASGFGRLTFGPRIMRTETAAPALLAAVAALRI